MKTLIISTSLNPESNSRRMARFLHETWVGEGREVDWADLQETDLPLCDGGAAYESPGVAKLGALVE